jgi:hypothetical protein
VSDKPCTFKKNDIKRAFQAAQAAGVNVSIEVRAGSMKLIPIDGAPDTAPESNPWDTDLCRESN